MSDERLSDEDLSTLTRLAELAICDSDEPQWPALLHALRELQRLRASADADAERLRAAEARVWPDGLTYGCDAADHLADEILRLRASADAGSPSREQLPSLGEIYCWLREHGESVGRQDYLNAGFDAGYLCAVASALKASLDDDNLAMAESWERTNLDDRLRHALASQPPAQTRETPSEEPR